MFQHFSRNRSLAQHRQYSAPVLQFIQQVNEHPLGYVEIGFSGYGIESPVALKIIFDGQIRSPNAPQNRIGHPRRIAEHENGFRQVGQNILPIELKKIRMSQFHPLAVCLSQFLFENPQICPVNLNAQKFPRMLKSGHRTDKKPPYPARRFNDTLGTHAPRQAGNGKSHLRDEMAFENRQTPRPVFFFGFSQS